MAKQLNFLKHHYNYYYNFYSETVLSTVQAIFLALNTPSLCPLLQCLWKGKRFYSYGTASTSLQIPYTQDCQKISWQTNLNGNLM